MDEATIQSIRERREKAEQTAGPHLAAKQAREQARLKAENDVRVLVQQQVDAANVQLNALGVLLQVEHPSPSAIAVTQVRGRLPQQPPVSLSIMISAADDIAVSIASNERSFRTVYSGVSHTPVVLQPDAQGHPAGTSPLDPPRLETWLADLVKFGLDREVTPP